MNERIKQLAEQAGYTDAYYESDDGPFVPAEFDKEKFAELIIRECAAMARGFEFAVKRDGLSTAIKEHFGVEK